MTEARHPIPTPDRIEAFHAFAVLWLMWLARIVFKLGAPKRSRRLDRWINRIERYVECLVFLTACGRVVAPVQSNRQYIRRAVSRGFRRAPPMCGRLFYKRARVRLRTASFHDRIARLIAVLADPEPSIARFAKCLARGLRGSRLLAVRPPAHTLASAAPLDIAFANSS